MQTLYPIPSSFFSKIEIFLRNYISLLKFSFLNIQISLQISLLPFPIYSSLSNIPISELFLSSNITELFIYNKVEYQKL